jgi:archaeal flagellar protein FlaJ
MEIKRKHIIGLAIGIILIGISFFFFGTKWFVLMIGIGAITCAGPVVYDIIKGASIEAEKEQMFLEFMQNLAESVKTGTPISKSITNVRKKPYGVLGVHVTKLANQILMGIPLNNALQTFSNDVRNKNISRALKLIGQAERAGGNIEQILESVSKAVSTSDKLKKERKAAISALVIQGYIIFIIFIAIILVMQFKIFPMIAGISGFDPTSMSSGATPINSKDIGGSFIYLMLVQGFFSGLVIGKLAEGDFKTGIKHSFALMMMSFVISTVANIIMG